MIRLVIVALISLVIGFLLGLAAYQLPSYQCLQGDYLVPNMTYGGLVRVGDASICGWGLNFEGIYGPSIEEFKRSWGN